PRDNSGAEARPRPSDLGAASAWQAARPPIYLPLAVSNLGATAAAPWPPAAVPPPPATRPHERATDSAHGRPVADRRRGDRRRLAPVARPRPRRPRPGHGVAEVLPGGRPET